jgi:hypothetical protein
MTLTPRASGPDVKPLIHGGYVLTMDCAGGLPGGDARVRDGVIQSIGKNLDVPEAQLFDASGKDPAGYHRRRAFAGPRFRLTGRGATGSRPAFSI